MFKKCESRNKGEPARAGRLALSILTRHAWYRYLICYESIHRFYDDGIEVFSDMFTQAWVGNDIDLLIGYHPEIPSANFIGSIDEARIYRGALTRDEILRDMNSSSIPEPSTLFLFAISLKGLAFIHRFS